MATTRVSVDPSGTIPLTGGAQGPLPCWISIQQSTLSPLKKCTHWLKPYTSLVSLQIRYDMKLLKHVILSTIIIWMTSKFVPIAEKIYNIKFINLTNMKICVCKSILGRNQNYMY